MNGCNIRQPDGLIHVVEHAYPNDSHENPAGWVDLVCLGALGSDVHGNTLKNYQKLLTDEPSTCFGCLAGIHPPKGKPR